MFFRIATITAPIGLSVLAVAISVASRNAQAYPFYVDFQAGAGRYMDTTTPVFNSGVSGYSDIGLAFNLGFFYTPLEPRHGFDFQVGIESIFLSSQIGSASYSTVIPYLTARAQFWMVYVSAGLSPLVWLRGRPGAGFDNFSQSDNTLSYFAEIAALYPATPKFSMGSSLNLQFFSSSGILSMAPATSLTFVMRFYFNLFDIGSNGPGTANPLEFDGWRYIGK